MKRISMYSMLACMFMVSPALAQTGEWSDGSDIKARLIAAPEKGSKTIQSALQIDLSEGWHTYWRVSGDSGLPPLLSWAESENIENVEIFWPAPVRKQEMDFYTFGYDTDLTLPLVVTLKDPAQKSVLDLNAQIMICKDICIPQRIEISLPIAQDGDFTEEAKHITESYKTIPQKINSDAEETLNLNITSIVVGKDAIVLSITSKNGFEGIDVFPVIEESLVALTKPAQITVSEHDPKQALLRIEKGADFENLAQELQDKTVTVVMTKGDKAIEKTIAY